jgi:DNA-binding CsgD family transcriptional regulator
MRKTRIEQKSKSYAAVPEVGLVLMDETLRVVGCDRGAVAILNLPDQSEAAKRSIPLEILEAIQSRTRAGVPYSKMRFPTASGEYVCRSYLVEPEDGGVSGTLVALHLERASMGDLAIGDIAAKYHLSEREEETLKGVLMGLSTKEIADQMMISPNTVKAYIRLMTIKLGVTTRWGIISKVMGARQDIEEPPSHSRAHASMFD